MEDYKGNSNLSKQQAAVEEQTKQPIANGTVKKQSGLGNFGKAIVSEDAASVGKHIREDVFFPSIKKMIVDIVKTGVDWLIYGRKSTTTNGPRVAGGNVSYWARQSTGYSQPSYATSQGNGTGFSLDLIELPDRGSAEAVLQRLKDDIATYGTVSCGSYYEYVNVRCPFTAEKYGWRDLSQATIERRSNGTYAINFPRIQTLD